MIIMTSSVVEISQREYIGILYNLNVKVLLCYYLTSSFSGGANTTFQVWCFLLICNYCMQMSVCFVVELLTSRVIYVARDVGLISLYICRLCHVKIARVLPYRSI